MTNSINSCNNCDHEINVGCGSIEGIEQGAFLDQEHNLAYCYPCLNACEEAIKLGIFEV